MGKLRELDDDTDMAPPDRYQDDDVMDLDDDGPGLKNMGTEEEDPGEENDEEEEEDEWEPGEVMDDIADEEDIFHFVPFAPQQVGIGEAGPGPSTMAAASRNAQSRFLSDDDDTQVQDIHPTAGKKVIRMDKDLHNRWAALFEKDPEQEGGVQVPVNGFAPFASELDWRVAHWAVRDGPGNNAFDRLLAIPGVR